LQTPCQIPRVFPLKIDSDFTRAFPVSQQQFIAVMPLFITIFCMYFHVPFRPFLVIFIVFMPPLVKHQLFFTLKLYL